MEVKMEVEWMNHTGFVVSDMERSLEFYQDLLGLKQERNQILEGSSSPSWWAIPTPGCTSSTWELVTCGIPWS